MSDAPVFRLDEEAAFKRLSSPTFNRPPSQLEYGEIVDALDEASGLVVLASQLAENAKVVARLSEERREERLARERVPAPVATAPARPRARAAGQGFRWQRLFGR